MSLNLSAPWRQQLLPMGLRVAGILDAGCWRTFGTAAALAALENRRRKGANHQPGALFTLRNVMKGGGGRG